VSHAGLENAPYLRPRLAAMAVGVSVVACGDPEPPSALWDFESGACGRGLVVVDSDYASTTVNLLDTDGVTRVAGVLTSADRPAGLTAALSGDVVLPSSASTGDEVVAIDRETAVLSWIGITDGSLRQLSVATGFFSNPHDYVPTEDGQALIPRFGENRLEPSRRYDRGNDLLVVDPRSEEIVGSIPLDDVVADEPEGVRPTADRALFIDGAVYVTAPSFDRTFEAPADSRLVKVDARTGTIESVLVFDGSVGCGSLAASPSGRRLAIPCTGRYGEGVPIEQSKLVVVDVAGELRVTDELSASDLDGSQLGAAVAFADEGTVVFSTSSSTDDDLRPVGRDALHSFRLPSAGCTGDCIRPLHDAGPFALGSVACQPSCGRCYATDASALDGLGGIIALRSAGGEVEVESTFAVDDPTGLPPRHVSLF